MNLDKIKKYVINLDDRTDRLAHIKKEFDFIGWDFERFSAVNTNSFKGCGLSHQEIAQKAIDEDLDYYMVFEDDVFFMPYFHEKLNLYMEELSKVDWDMFHFGPAFHIKTHFPDSNLIHLNKDVAEKTPKDRGVFCTQAMLIKKSLFHELFKWDKVTEKWKNPGCQQPVDMFFSEYIYKNFNCYCGNWPLATQLADYSTINKGVYNVHYIITYNWQGCVNKNFPKRYMNLQNCLNERK